MSIRELLIGINQEDAAIPAVIKGIIPAIESLVGVTADRLRAGGRLFYIGAGTSGRLGVVDASEIPPTYGVPPGIVVGIIAGGDAAIRKSVENAEDDPHQAWKDLTAHAIRGGDVVIGIAASGRTPYVIGGVKEARSRGIVTGCITCNAGTELAHEAEYPIAAVVGPEFVTGSTRMKAGTAQKLILNMISTTVMIQLGHVKGNRMVDMQLTNTKLVGRAVQMIMDELNITREPAEALLKKYGNVRSALQHAK